MRTLLIAVLLVATSTASAAPLLYRIADDDSTVWLLGSVHALRASDYPLHDAIMAAYEDADRVVLEVDPVEMQPAHMAGLMMSLARSEQGSLADALTTAEIRELKNALAPLGVDIAQLQPFEPWFVALQVFALNLARNGYTGDSGVDSWFAARAAEDGKPTGGLETAREQLDLFDRMPERTQVDFLMDSVRDAPRFREEMNRLVNLWRDGDAEGLERLIEEEFAGEAELREAMLERRNRNWIAPISDYLHQPDDTLVIVGALHLVGNEGVIELLRKKGYRVERVK